MRPIFLFFLVFSISLYAETEESFESFIKSKVTSVEDSLCADSVMIEEKAFCVKESRITLNSCGKRSDWPCLDAEGCLKIKKYVRNDQE